MDSAGVVNADGSNQRFGDWLPRVAFAAQFGRLEVPVFATSVASSGMNGSPDES